jgi:hypothetical protein
MTGVEYTDEFEGWWNSLDEDEQESIAVSIALLEEKGTSLRYPYCSGVKQSKHSHMRELRTQHRGDPYRTLYAFDPRRVAVLLIGGCKVGDDNWYNTFVPKADAIYDQHLKELGQERLEKESKDHG